MLYLQKVLLIHLKLCAFYTIRTYETYLNNSLFRCTKVWEMPKSEVQRATTKVKFKSFINQCVDQYNG